MNQSSKSELYKILVSSFVYDDNSAGAVFLQDEAKQQLLQLALSCLPERQEVDNTALHNENTQAVANALWNSAIDTIEANILRKFS